MNKNARVASIAVIVALAVAFLVVVGRDIFLTGRPIDCGDGPRRAIDIRDFTTQYSGYSVEFEADIVSKGKISARLSPVQLQQLSDATQNAREFRKYVVAGYNSCAITKAQFGQYGARFQALDGLAREINDLTGKSSLTPEETAELAELIGQYGDLARKPGTD